VRAPPPEPKRGQRTVVDCKFRVRNEYVNVQARAAGIVLWQGGVGSWPVDRQVTSLSLILDTPPAHSWLPPLEASPRQVAAFCSPRVSIDLCAEQSRLGSWRQRLAIDGYLQMAANGTTLKSRLRPRASAQCVLYAVAAIPYRGGERYLSIAFTRLFLSIPSSNGHARSPRKQKPPHRGYRGLDVAFAAMPRQGGVEETNGGADSSSELDYGSVQRWNQKR
jgi:hypothetical protein